MSYAITVDKTVYTSGQVRVAVWHDPYCVCITPISLPNGVYNPYAREGGERGRGVVRGYTDTRGLKKAVY